MTQTIETAAAELEAAQARGRECERELEAALADEAEEAARVKQAERDLDAALVLPRGPESDAAVGEAEAALLRAESGAGLTTRRVSARRHEGNQAQAAVKQAEGTLARAEHAAAYEVLRAAAHEAEQKLADFLAVVGTWETAHVQCQARMTTRGYIRRPADLLGDILKVAFRAHGVPWVAGIVEREATFTEAARGLAPPPEPPA
jgi:Holliday junction resolvase